MIDIARKRLPMPVLVILVYASYCAMSWFVMRGNLAYYGESYNWPKWFVNDVWAFFLGGIMSTIIFELIAWFMLRSLTMRTAHHGDIRAIYYGVHLTVIAANVVLFALKFMYFGIPMYASLVNIIIDPVVTLGFAALYLWYAFGQGYVEKPLFRFVVSQVYGTFLIVYGVLSLVNIMVVVTAK